MKVKINPLCANPTKWSNTLKQFVGKLPTNCLRVSDHFVILVLEGLTLLYYILLLLYYFPETLKFWIDVQWGQSYLMGRRCLFSLG